MSIQKTEIQPEPAPARRRSVLLILAAGLALLLVLAVVWLLSRRGDEAGYQPGSPATLSNPALNLRLTYDADMFSVHPYDPQAEFPLRLDGEGLSFYGKRIRGIATVLEKDPGPMLYDFVATEHEDVFGWYRLETVKEPFYEDAQIAGQLGIHEVLEYRRGEGSPGWPPYFPEEVQSGELAVIEGWATFTARDLFYFYAIAPAQLTDEQQRACVGILSSLQFDAVLGSGEEGGKNAKAADKSKEDELPAIEDGDKDGRPGIPDLP